MFFGSTVDVSERSGLTGLIWSAATCRRFCTARLVELLGASTSRRTLNIVQNGYFSIEQYSCFGLNTVMQPNQQHSAGDFFSRQAMVSIPWLVASKVFTFVLYFVISVVIVRGLSAADYGVYSLLNSIAERLAVAGVHLDSILAFFDLFLSWCETIIVPVCCVF